MNAIVTKFWRWQNIEEWPVAAQYGCSTCRILSHFCILNIFVRSHLLCPKWAAAPWHTGAKQKKNKVSLIASFFHILGVHPGGSSVTSCWGQCAQDVCMSSVHSVHLSAQGHQLVQHIRSPVRSFRPLLRSVVGLSSQTNWPN